MKTIRRVVIPVLACAAIWLGLAAAPAATERKPLPTFTVTATGGGVVASADLTHEGRWLFVYVQPACEECRTLLATIDETDQPRVAARMVIVVGGVDDAGLAAFSAAFPKLTTAAWYADSERAVPPAVKAPGLPFVFGMKQRITEWGMIGVVPDATAVRSALVSWAGER